MIQRQVLLMSIVCALCFGVFFGDCGISKAASGLSLKLHVVSLHQVKLSWNQVKDAKEYQIFRAECEVDNGITPGQDKKKTKKKLARLSGKHLTFQDKTVKKGRCYHYRVKAVTKNGSVTGGNIAHMVVQNVFWRDLDQVDNPVSPQAIHLYIDFNMNPWPRLEPDGIIIYRGSRWDKLTRLKSIAIQKKGNSRSHPSETYQDKTVTPGKTYYYLVKPYVKEKGKKIYGINTGYRKLSAILPAGDYTAAVQSEDSGKEIEVSLSGRSEGNAKLDFIENQFNGLTELFCRKKDGNCDAVSLKLKSYCLNEGSWNTFDGQDISLKGKEKMTFRFVPALENESVPASFEECEEVEILFRLKYEDDERDIHVDGKTGEVLLTGVGGSTSAEYQGHDFFPSHYKGNKKAQKVAEPFLEGMFRGRYADYDTGITVSYVDDEFGEDVLSKRLLPDGVRIYRSTDNKSFQAVTDLFYKKGEYQIEFQDSSVQPGMTYYYKARNFITSKKGRVFSDSMKSSLPFYAQFSSICRYRVWHVNRVEGTMPGLSLDTPQIFGIQGLSCGNPTTILNSSGETYAVVHNKAGGYHEVLDEKITEYSLDGMTWSKLPETGKKLSFLPKQMVYLKLEIDTAENLTEDLDEVKEFGICMPLKTGIGEAMEWNYTVKQGTAAASVQSEEYD